MEHEIVPRCDMPRVPLPLNGGALLKAAMGVLLWWPSGVFKTSLPPHLVTNVPNSWIWHDPESILAPAVVRCASPELVPRQDIPAVRAMMDFDAVAERIYTSSRRMLERGLLGTNDLIVTVYLSGVGPYIRAQFDGPQRLLNIVAIAFASGRHELSDKEVAILDTTAGHEGIQYGMWVDKGAPLQAAAALGVLGMRRLVDEPGRLNGEPPAVTTMNNAGALDLWPEPARARSLTGILCERIPAWAATFERAYEGEPAPSAGEELWKAAADE